KRIDRVVGEDIEQSCAASFHGREGIVLGARRLDGLDLDYKRLRRTRIRAAAGRAGIVLQSDGQGGRAGSARLRRKSEPAAWIDRRRRSEESRRVGRDIEMQ